MPSGRRAPLSYPSPSYPSSDNLQDVPSFLLPNKGSFTFTLSESTLKHTLDSDAGFYSGFDDGSVKCVGAASARYGMFDCRCILSPIACSNRLRQASTVKEHSKLSGSMIAWEAVKP